MRLVRKIVAIVVMVLAVVGLLICIAGLAGTWIINTPVTNAVTGLLGTAHDYLGLADQAAQSAGATVADVTQQLDALGQAATNLSGEQKAQISARVEGITQPIASVSSLASSASEGLAGLNSTLNALSGIPRLNIPQPEADLAGMSDRLNTVSTRLDELRSAATTASPDGKRVQAAAGALSNELQGVQNQLDRWSAGVGKTQTAIQTASGRVPGVIDLVSTAATLFALLFGAGQVSLFILALHGFRRP